MANEENKGYKEFMEFVESATKEQIMDGIYRVIPQMCTEDTWAEFKERLDNLTDTLNYMSQWNRVCELLQECKEKWNKYSSELYTYEDYLKIRKFREQYDSEGGKKGTGFSFPEYLPGEAKGISDKIINSSRKKREMPIPPSDFYETMETSVYKGYKQDKIEMRGDRAEMSDFPLYLNMVAGGLDCRDQAIGGFSFVVKIYAVPVVEIIG